LKQTQVRTIIVLAVLVGISLAAYGLYLTQEKQVVALTAPITHQPTYLANPVFILGSGNVVQNRTAYSYVRINASAIYKADFFTVLPALNIGLKGGSLNENNLTAEVTYTGSSFGASPYWINFSVSLPELGTVANLSQLGVAGNFSRTFVSLPHFGNAEFFLQVSNVVGENNEYELFFYIGNSTIPVPQLAHGPPH
jgi:hypothetical protein